MQPKPGSKGTPHETVPAEQKEYSPGRDDEGEPEPPALDDLVAQKLPRNRPAESPVHRVAGARAK